MHDQEAPKAITSVPEKIHTPWKKWNIPNHHKRGPQLSIVLIYVPRYQLHSEGTKGNPPNIYTQHPHSVFRRAFVKGFIRLKGINDEFRPKLLL